MEEEKMMVRVRAIFNSRTVDVGSIPDTTSIRDLTMQLERVEGIKADVMRLVSKLTLVDVAYTLREYDIQEPEQVTLHNVFNYEQSKLRWRPIPCPFRPSPTTTTSTAFTLPDDILQLRSLEYVKDLRMVSERDFLFTLCGPAGTLYEGCRYIIHGEIPPPCAPSSYDPPLNLPRLRFLTPILHPLIHIHPINIKPSRNMAIAEPFIGEKTCKAYPILNGCMFLMTPIPTDNNNNHNNRDRYLPYMYAEYNESTSTTTWRGMSFREGVEGMYRCLSIPIIDIVPALLSALSKQQQEEEEPQDSYTTFPSSFAFLKYFGSQLDVMEQKIEAMNTVYGRRGNILLLLSTIGRQMKLQGYTQQQKEEEKDEEDEDEAISSSGSGIILPKMPFYHQWQREAIWTCILLTKRIPSLFNITLPIELIHHILSILFQLYSQEETW